MSGQVGDHSRLEVIQPAVEKVPSKELLPPSPEQGRAAEALFSQGEEENPAAALLAFWSAGMLLKDITQDAEKKDEGRRIKDAK